MHPVQLHRGASELGLGCAARDGCDADLADDAAGMAVGKDVGSIHMDTLRRKNEIVVIISGIQGCHGGQRTVATRALPFRVLGDGHKGLQA